MNMSSLQEAVPEISGVLESISVAEVTTAVRTHHGNKAVLVDEIWLEIIVKSHSSAARGNASLCQSYGEENPSDSWKRSRRNSSGFAQALEQWASSLFMHSFVRGLESILIQSACCLWFGSVYHRIWSLYEQSYVCFFAIND